MASAGREHPEIAGNKVPSKGSTNMDALTAMGLNLVISKTKLRVERLPSVFRVWFCSEPQLN